MAEFSPEGDPLNANLQVWRMLGRNDVGTPADAPPGLLSWIVKPEAMARLKRGDDVTTESKIIDGHEHWLLAQLSPLLDAYGAIVKIILPGSGLKIAAQAVTPFAPSIRALIE